MVWTGFQNPKGGLSLNDFSKPAWPRLESKVQTQWPKWQTMLLVLVKIFIILFYPAQS